MQFFFTTLIELFTSLLGCHFPGLTPISVATPFQTFSNPNDLFSPYVHSFFNVMKLFTPMALCTVYSLVTSCCSIRNELLPCTFICIQVLTPMSKICSKFQLLTFPPELASLQIFATTVSGINILDAWENRGKISMKVEIWKT